MKHCLCDAVCEAEAGGQLRCQDEGFAPPPGVERGGEPG